MKRIIQFIVLSFSLLLLFSGNPALANDDTEKDQKRIEQQRKRYESMPTEEKKRVKEAREKYRKMSPEEQRRLKEKWEKAQKKKPKKK